MTVAIVKTEWTGTSGGVGLSQMAVVEAGAGDFSDASAQIAVNAVRAFWDALKGIFPTDITQTVLPTVDSYNQDTGALTDSQTAATPPAAVVGTATAGYHAAAGGKIDWTTGVVIAGRRVVGRTYLVPLGSTNYEVDGTIQPGTITAVNSAATTLRTTLSNGGLALVVWSRPGNKITPPGLTIVTGGNMKNKTAVLRGRRD